MVPRATEARVTDRRVALWLLGVFVLIYTGTAKGILEQVDDVAMLRVTQSIMQIRIGVKRRRGTSPGPVTANNSG